MILYSQKNEIAKNICGNEDLWVKKEAQGAIFFIFLCFLLF